MCYQIKKQLILAGINYKKKHSPFDVQGNELFTIPADAPHDINSSFFLGGHTLQGETITMRFGFRNGVEDEIFILYRHGGKLLYMEADHYPKASFPARVECVKVGNAWRYLFDGYLRDEEGKRYSSSFNLLFTGRLPIYDFLHSPTVFEGMARSIAHEKWSRTFFRQLSEINQLHYEQTGWIEGTVTIDGQTETIHWPAVRDRAIGHRKWDFMNCHIWLNCVTEKGEGLTFSIVNYPSMKNLYSGYTDFESDENATLVEYELQHYSHNDGLGTDTIIVETEWSNGKHLRIEAKRDENVFCTFDNGDYIFQEGIGPFLLNGVPARGNIEYGFNKDSLRWGEYNPRS